MCGDRLAKLWGTALSAMQQWSDNVLISFHLLPVTQLALIVAQQRDKANNLSGIFLSALDEGLKKIYKAAKRTKGAVKHFMLF